MNAWLIENDRPNRVQRQSQGTRTGRLSCSRCLSFPCGDPLDLISISSKLMSNTTKMYGRVMSNEQNKTAKRQDHKASGNLLEQQ